MTVPFPVAFQDLTLIPGYKQSFLTFPKAGIFCAFKLFPWVQPVSSSKIAIWYTFYMSVLWFSIFLISKNLWKLWSLGSLIDQSFHIPHPQQKECFVLLFGFVGWVFVVFLMDDTGFFCSCRSRFAQAAVFPAATLKRGGHGREGCCSGVLRFWVPPSHLHVAARRWSAPRQVAQSSVGRVSNSMFPWAKYRRATE